jgi:hypothetical protein
MLAQRRRAMGHVYQWIGGRYPGLKDETGVILLVGLDRFRQGLAQFVPGSFIRTAGVPWCVQT